MERTRTRARHLWLVRTEQEPAAPRSELDAGLNRALMVMHDAPEQAWTVSALARKAGMSRPVFARRFRTAFGTSPKRYLSALRLERARELVEGSELPLAVIAERVGFVSQFAFNRAFKRRFRLPPGIYRREIVRMHGGGARLAA